MKTSAWLASVCVLTLHSLACSSGEAADPGGGSGGTGGGADGSVDSPATDGTDDAGTGGNGDTGADANDDAGNSDADSGDVESGTEAGGIRDECRATAYSDHACGVCMEAHCAAECEACTSDSDCVSWLACAVQCASQACEDACTGQFPGGKAPAYAWYGGYGCIDMECRNECLGGSPMPLCDSGLTTNDPDCDNCLDDHCCQVVKACQADTACDHCLMNGTPDSCGGNANYAALDACWGGTCGTACGGVKSCGLSTNGANPTCDACIQTDCCDQGLACANGLDANQNGESDCIDVLNCVQNCSTGDTACEDACNAAQPDGAALLADFFGCLSQACSTDCQ